VALTTVVAAAATNHQIIKSTASTTPLRCHQTVWTVSSTIAIATTHPIQPLSSSSQLPLTHPSPAHPRQPPPQPTSSTTTIFVHQLLTITAALHHTQEREQQIEALEKSIRSIHEAQENKLKQLHPEKLQQYLHLVEENQEVSGKVMSQRSEIEMIKSKIQHLEMEVEKDKYRQLAVDLTKQVDELRKESEQLEETARTCRMDPEEARTILLTKLKTAQERKKTVEDQIDDIEHENNKTRKAVMDITTNLNEQKGDKGRDEPSKYEQLLKKDAQMTQFIEGFQATVNKEMDDQMKAKENIVGLLEHISAGVNADVSNMSKARLGEMKEDLSFKSKQMETSQATKVRLEQELQKREVELQKLNNLDGKIAVELESLNETMRKKREEMVHFDKIDELKDAAEATTALLERTKRGYLRRRDAIKQQVHAQAVKLDQKKNKLAESDTHKMLLSMEKRLRHHTQTTFQMQEYIEKMTRETDFKTTKYVEGKGSLGSCLLSTPPSLPLAHCVCFWFLLLF
jgi:hypothetical protein